MVCLLGVANLQGVVGFIK